VDGREEGKEKFMDRYLVPTYLSWKGMDSEWSAVTYGSLPNGRLGGLGRNNFKRQKKNCREARLYKVNKWTVFIYI